MSTATYQIILWIIVGAALARSIGILLLKIRQFRYLDRAVAAPRSWRDHCTEPEPPMLGVVALVLVSLMEPSVPSWTSAALGLGGLLLSSIGWVLIIWAALAFPSVSPGHYILAEQQIVTSGPYGHIRNPLYAGAILIWLALGIAFESSVILGITFLYVVPAYLINMRSEEKMLLGYFGDPYDRYRQSVGMLFPRLRSWRDSTGD